MARIALLGSTGILGRCVVQRLVRDGHEVLGLSRKDGLDVAEPDSFNGLPGDFDWLVNCTGVISVSRDNLQQAFMTNAFGSLSAATWANRLGARFINCSTISALPGCWTRYCRSYYATTKRAGDELVENYCTQHSSPFALLRFPQLYDSDAKAEKYQPMLYRMIRQLKYEARAVVYGGKSPRRNFLHLADAAAAIGAVVSQDLSGTWNCLHPESIDVIGMIRVISSVLGCTAKVELMLAEEDIPVVTIPDKDLFHERCPNWHPRPLASGVQDILDSGAV